MVFFPTTSHSWAFVVPLEVVDAELDDAMRQADMTGLHPAMWGPKIAAARHLLARLHALVLAGRAMTTRDPLPPPGHLVSRITTCAL